jgi:hypothetical protein
MPELPRPETSPLRHVATFCGQCNCGCPELYVDPTADDESSPTTSASASR